METGKCYICKLNQGVKTREATRYIPGYSAFSPWFFLYHDEYTCGRCQTILEAAQLKEKIKKEKERNKELKEQEIEYQKALKYLKRSQ